MRFLTIKNEILKSILILLLNTCLQEALSNWLAFKIFKMYITPGFKNMTLIPFCICYMNIADMQIVDLSLPMYFAEAMEHPYQLK